MLPFSYIVFTTVLSQGTFYNAAKVLNVTPSAISHSINQLEQELGFPVFYRSRSGVSLTANGEKLLPLIQQIINTQERITQLAKQIQGLDIGIIRIGAFSSACINWLPPVIQSFKKKYPQVKITVKQAGFAEITQEVKNGSLDIGITMLPAKEPGILSQKLIEDEIYCVAPKGFATANKKSVSQADLRDYNFILQKSDYDWDTKAALDHYQISPTAIQFSIDDQSIIAMVEAGLGLGILPALALQKNTGKVEILPFEEPFFRKIGLVTTKSASITPSNKAMIKQFQNFIASTYPNSVLTI